MNNTTLDNRLQQIEQDLQSIKRMLEQILVGRVLSPIPKNNDVYTVKQASLYLGLDVNTIYAKCAKGIIPFFKIGRGYRFNRTELDLWLTSSKVKKSALSADDYVNQYLQNKRFRI